VCPITIEILEGIRDEVRGVRDEVRVTNAATNERIDALRDQQVRAEMHIAAELVASTAEFRALREDLKSLGMRARLDDHERRIEALEKRTG
jgi:hypothetical protein